MAQPPMAFRLVIAAIMPIIAFPIAGLTEGNFMARIAAVAVVGACQVLLLRPFIKSASVAAGGI